MPERLLPRRACILLSCILALPCAAAPAHRAAELEARARALSEQLRCVVCQNQSIADSQAELAVDLRRHVREGLAQGMSDEQVIDSVVRRYGDFVLYRPPFRAGTLVLWLGPLVLLGGGIAALLRRLARQVGPQDSVAPADLARAARLLEDREAP